MIGRPTVAALLLGSIALLATGTGSIAGPVAAAAAEPGAAVQVDALTDAEGTCGATSEGTCTLRAALGGVDAGERPTVVQLPSGILLQTSDAPFVVHGSVEVRGAPEGTVVVAGTASRVFRLAPGATLRLVGLRVEGGDPSSPTTIGPGRLELRGVRVGALPGSTASPGDLGAICGPGGGALVSLDVASAEITDPLGSRSLPGAIA